MGHARWQGNPVPRPPWRARLTAAGGDATDEGDNSMAGSDSEGLKHQKQKGVKHQKGNDKKGAEHKKGSDEKGATRQKRPGVAPSSARTS